MSGLLLLHPMLLYCTWSFVDGWVLIGEFIIMLAMALKYSPPSAGGLPFSLLRGISMTSFSFSAGNHMGQIFGALRYTGVKHG
ncbi:hypothetical protein [uncultured Pseudodesulfovibrio sp.]|uniref:hypothetical protein n=1 Tax=uncultured Pseudodesulfovibrio sp. TaxID=2035858 RepID=UPI0037486C1E